MSYCEASLFQCIDTGRRYDSESIGLHIAYIPRKYQQSDNQRISSLAKTEIRSLTKDSRSPFTQKDQKLQWQKFSLKENRTVSEGREERKSAAWMTRSIYSSQQGFQLNRRAKFVMNLKLQAGAVGWPRGDAVH